MESSSLSRTRTSRRKENVKVQKIVIFNPRKDKCLPGIQCVAILCNNTGNMYSLPAPNRHHHVLCAMIKEGITGGREEGFLTVGDQFVNREVVMVLAVANNQIRIRLGAKSTDYDGHELFSEDLW